MNPCHYKTYYKILDDNKNIIDCDGIVEWRKFMTNMSKRRVALDSIVNYTERVEISTVFLGTNHSMGKKPLYFETLIIGGDHHGDIYRYSTWEDAEKGHTRIVQMIKAELNWTAYM